MNESNGDQPQIAQPIQRRPELTILPSEGLRQIVEAQREEQTSLAPAVDYSSLHELKDIYQPIPGAPTRGAPNGAQSLGMADMLAKTKEVNRPVCMRVKSVLVIGILLLLSSLILVISSLSEQGGTIPLLIGMIQLLMTLGILFSKDHNTVSLILKFFLVLQGIGLPIECL